MQICACPVYVYMVQHSVLLRRPPRGATPFFFFFLEKKDEVSYEFLQRKVCRNGEFGLRIF